MFRVTDLRFAFELLLEDLASLASAWRPHAPRALVDAVVGGASDRLSALLAAATRGPIARPLDVVLDDAYLDVLSLAGLFHAASEEDWANPVDLACAFESVLDVLDVLAPCASPDVRALRHAAVDGLDLTAACLCAESTQPFGRSAFPHADPIQLCLTRCSLGASPAATCADGAPP